ncbi:MAG: demethoxyubiquinone hydroxylase family protein [Desulfotomaculum sp.]|nr:demethoxyubiquinone hydroxylase family protein [Desulfotomaculum sp.]
MSNLDKNNPEDLVYDVAIIRPEMRDADIKIRGRDFSPERLKKIKKGLHTLHWLENMATNIYRYQITKEPSELNRSLTAAMCNEMTHIQDFQVKLLEYGWKTSPCHLAFKFAGAVLGFGSRLMGKKTMLKLGVWVETKAVEHYTELLRDVDWDEDTRKIIEKDKADEDGHVHHWTELLEKA